MRTFCLSILAFMLAVAYEASGQHSISRIEAANTSTQVEELIHSTDKNFSNFRVDEPLHFTDERVDREYQKAGAKAWEKADLDGNGRLDLLVIGTGSDDESRVVCLLDMGSKLVLEPFERSLWRFCPVVRIIYDGSKPLISYTDFASLSSNVDSLQDRQQFTLTYKYGGLVEYNKNPTRVALDSLYYTSSLGYHGFSQMDLAVSAKGGASYVACEWPNLNSNEKRCETLKGTLTTQSLADILDLVGYIEPKKLKSKYRLGPIHHVPRATLILVYSNGERQEIQDIGETGTFGLMRLYALLDQLRETQQWQTVKP